MKLFVVFFFLAILYTQLVWVISVTPSSLSSIILYLVDEQVMQEKRCNWRTAVFHANPGLASFLASFSQHFMLRTLFGRIFLLLWESVFCPKSLLPHFPKDFPKHFPTHFCSLMTSSVVKSESRWRCKKQCKTSFMKPILWLNRRRVQIICRFSYFARPGVLHAKSETWEDGTKEDLKYRTFLCGLSFAKLEPEVRLSRVFLWDSLRLWALLVFDFKDHFSLLCCDLKSRPDVDDDISFHRSLHWMHSLYCCRWNTSCFICSSTKSYCVSSRVVLLACRWHSIVLLVQQAFQRTSSDISLDDMCCSKSSVKETRVFQRKGVCLSCSIIILNEPFFYHFLYDICILCPRKLF